MSAKLRTGVLGGTFDPVHLGHRDVAVAARNALGLEVVLLVPTRVPLHRPRSPIASAAHRFAMVQLAAADEDWFEVSDVELASDGPSYTSLTLQTLTHGNDAAQYFFITGADTFAEIATWHDYPGVLDLSHFLVVSRPGHPVGRLRHQLPELASRMRLTGDVSGDGRTTGRTAIWLIDAQTRDISSSEIRTRLALGRPIDDLVSHSVAAYVVRHSLYTETGVDAVLQTPE